VSEDGLECQDESRSDCTTSRDGFPLFLVRRERFRVTISAISDAVRWAEEIMKAIDERWPAGR
jgi:hypothetical protein